MIANPRHLRGKGADACRARRVAAPQAEGLHQPHEGRVPRRRAAPQRPGDPGRSPHKTALRLLRDNQAVYVEDLAVSGLARSRLAKSVHDAGWATLVRLLEEKAERCHRQVVKVGRWFPSSQLCSQCGLGRPEAAEVREWTCAACGVRHDRDVNAARNVRLEGRKVAAGQAETLNGCGADCQTGTRPGRSR